MSMKPEEIIEKMFTLDGESRLKVKSFFKNNNKVLREALDLMYERVSKIDELKGFLESPQKIEILKDRQLKHWESIFNAETPKEAYDIAYKIGSTHLRINLSPLWFISAYALIFDNLCNVLAKTQTPEQITLILPTVCKMIFRDITVGIINYYEENTKAIDKKVAALQKLETEMQSIVNTLKDKSIYMVGQTKEMVNLSNNTINSIKEVVDDTEESAHNSNNVAKSTIELARVISEIYNKVEASANNLNESKSNIDKSVNNSNTIAEAIKNIGNVVDMIRSIASKTRLLSLNASIEAARAGDAGKGFALVASEVKNLSNQTQSFTEKIQSEMQQAQSLTQNLTKVMTETYESMQALDEISSDIKNSMHQQEESTKTITSNIQEVAIKADGISKNVNTVQDIATNTAGNASKLSEISEEFIKLSAEIDAKLSECLEELKG